MGEAFAGTCSEYLSARLQELGGRGVEIVGRQRVAGGSINRTEMLELKSGARLFVKWNSAELDGLFRGEAAGLQALGAAGVLRVPQVLGRHQDEREQVLLLEYIPSGSEGANFWEYFARGLADQHRVSSPAGFGFEADNHLGATEQLNGWLPGWHEFYARRRIGFQLQLAYHGGRVDGATMALGERFMGRIPQLLPDAEASSLLHGDLWGGNFMVDGSGSPVLIDPAVYYGHREADIAMTQLFGGFSTRFYEAYNEIWPLDPGFAGRRDAYNLYHLLNHLNLFGSSYAGSVHAILRRYS